MKDNLELLRASAAAFQESQGLIPVTGEIYPQVRGEVEQAQRSILATMVAGELPPAPDYLDLLNQKMAEGVQLLRVGFGDKTAFAEVNAAHPSENYHFYHSPDIESYQRMILIDGEQLFCRIEDTFYRSTDTEVIALFSNYISEVIERDEERPQQYKYISSVYSQLSSEERQQYLDTAHGIALEAFNWEDLPGKREETERVLNQGRQIVVSAERKSVGFISTIHYPRPNGGILYVDGVAVLPEYKREGFGKELSVRALSETIAHGDDVTYVAGITQNPRVAQLRASYSSIVYPIDILPTEEILEVARHIQNEKGWVGMVEEDTLIMRDFYEGEEMERKPTRNYPAINDYFDKNVGRYDGIFIIGELPVRR